MVGEEGVRKDSEERWRNEADKSDVNISIYPHHVIDIVNRIKNHEFRKYRLPVTTKRLWIYETTP